MSSMIDLHYNQYLLELFPLSLLTHDDIHTKNLGLCLCTRKNGGREEDTWFLPVPVGEGHHHIEGGQGQHEVEEGVAVGHCVLLVVPHMLLTLLFISRIRGS